MKTRSWFTVSLILVVQVAFSQSSFTVSGGLATAAPDNSSSSFSGFKASGQYEYGEDYNNWAIGGSLSYLGFQHLESDLTAKYHSWPINFYGKYLFGSKRIQGYIKGIIGAQFSTLKSETQSGERVKSTKFGMAVGTGAGANYSLTEKLFLNLDYEFLYLTNNYYNNGITNAVTLGVGFNFQ